MAVSSWQQTLGVSFQSSAGVSEPNCTGQVSRDGWLTFNVPAEISHYGHFEVFKVSS